VKLTILNVAYPFAPVGAGAVGGAEQILYRIDHALVAAEHRSIVIASEGSQIAGVLVPTPRVKGTIGGDHAETGRKRHRHAIVAALARWPIDLIHLHGVDFYTYMPPPGVPVLITLHLPIDWYPKEALQPARSNTWLHCVSRSQHEDCGSNPQLLAPIENGVPASLFRARHTKRRFALMLGRICPEKGVHHAIGAAKRAGMPLLIAGEVFPYMAHQRYFREEIEPRLDRWRRFVGPASLQRKRRLLAAAQCLLVPSLAPETSCLVAREAMASGTPVVAFARGALRDLVEHGRTGFLVQDETQMAEAIGNSALLDREDCRRAAQMHSSLERMIQRYFHVYQSLCRTPGKLIEAGMS
jgi:glycosyltransferase involved in cell wall biosynthesis